MESKVLTKEVHPIYEYETHIDAQRRKKKVSVNTNPTRYTYSILHEQLALVQLLVDAVIEVAEPAKSYKY